jgi:hypothetical protein
MGKPARMIARSPNRPHMRVCVSAILALSISAIFETVASAQAARTRPRQDLIGTWSPARACQREDLIGTWSLVKIEAEQAGVQEFYRHNPIEVMRFSPNGAFIYVARRAPFSAHDAKKDLDYADRVDGVSYEFKLQGGQLQLLQDGYPFEGFRCTFALRHAGQMKPGDIMLQNLMGRPWLLRIQRKLF